MIIMFKATYVVLPTWKNTVLDKSLCPPLTLLNLLMKEELFYFLEIDSTL